MNIFCFFIFYIIQNIVRESQHQILNYEVKIANEEGGGLRHEEPMLTWVSKDFKERQVNTLFARNF